MLFIGAFSLVGLSPDEAQYWTWSRELALGYYSKPPGISWQIFLTTALLGQNELGVRLGAMLLGTALTFVVYFLALAAKVTQKAALYAAFIFAVTPMGFYLSFAATTDGGAILFLTLALIPLVKALSNEERPNYLQVGLFVGLGALFKWTAYILWPLLGVALIFFPLLRSRQLFWGLVISAFALLPSIYWNWAHEWATFKHVFSTLHTGKKGGGNFFDYLGAQLALFSPLFFAALFFCCKKIRSSKNSALHFLSLFLLASLAIILLSSVKKMQPNWALYFYPPLFVLLGFYLTDKLRFVILASTISFCAILGSLLLPLLQAKTALPLSYKGNPYRQNMGVRALTTLLTEVGYKSDTEFLFADKYQNSSLLSFYAPNQKRAYFFNLGSSRKNQFSFWPQMEELELGKSGYFVVIENRTEKDLPWYEKHYTARLHPYFAKVSCCAKKPLFTANGVGVKHALVFKCDNYLGGAPAPAQTY